ncbi:hypothetical protein WL82_28990 [Burkholderia ubonensis]|uniref:hypothetical protein n=1 Tax=Burkholderia ubonensis TaxID=101571 RepID=UPI0007586427|nr:hypothetical protein [Burkholderia ubonensis]KWF15220.1 hypothetical protein WL82_28990 [Burkholderia ubonensis]
MYIWKRIDDPNDFRKLSEIAAGREADFASAYNLDEVGERLAEGINETVKYMLIELSYVDKDYRSTFYHFYSKKGRHYKADCLRVHFFDEHVSFDAASLSLTPQTGRLTDHYLGFVTIRPTFLFTIGRSIVSPRARRGAQGKLIVGKHKVHLLGYDLESKGFPWMQQHSDISVCAHAACWAILRHYSERYKKYRELLTHDVTRLAHPYDPGGLRPSKGLQLVHAERVLTEAGNYPVVNSVDQKADADKRKPFLKQMFAYLESGFPLFLGIAGEHAVAAIGYKWREGLQPLAPGIRHAWEMVESLVVADDNHLPYFALGETAVAPQRYKLDQVHAYIAPLPDKIFYPADAVETMSAMLPSLLTSVPFPQQDDLIIRYFITTAAALRRHMREHETEFPQELVNVFMQLPMAQFVWVVEYATHDDWNANRVSVRAVVDATASVHDNDVLWAVYGKGVGLFFDREHGEPPLELRWNVGAQSTFGRMETNLQPVQAV